MSEAEIVSEIFLLFISKTLLECYLADVTSFILKYITFQLLKTGWIRINLQKSGLSPEYQITQ